MQILTELFEVVFRAEMFVQPVKILLPVAMVGLPVHSSLLQIECDGRDPNSSKTQVLDVVQVIDDALVGSTAVRTEIACCGRTVVGTAESVSQYLINRTCPPVCRGCSQRAYT